MAEYSYEAKKGPDEIMRGTLSAASYQEAIKLIEEKGYMPIKVVLIPEVSHSGSSVISPPQPTEIQNSTKTVKSRYQPVQFSTYQVCVFTRQLAGFLRASVPLLNALELIRAKETNRNLQNFLKNVVEQIRNGARFSEALEECGGQTLGGRYISLIRSGEYAGSLEHILELLADHLEKEEEIRGQIRAALTYPVMILIVGAATIFFLFIYCIPKLSLLFNQTYVNLPLPTKILMSFAEPRWQFFFWVFWGLAGVWFLYLFWGGSRAKRMRDGIVLRLPILSRIFLKSSIARFSGTLAMMIENGISTHEAVEITRPVLANELLKDDLKDAQSRLLGGEMLTDVIKDTKYFQPFFQQLIAVGEESGQLSRTLLEVDRFYSRESLRDIKIMTSLIEPLFILFLSGIVGFIVAAIMLPIFSMNWVH